MADPTRTSQNVAVVKTGPQPDPLLGRVINDRFKILAVIARGGMGKVYKAEQAPLGRICAVKVLNPNYNGDHDPEFHKRFTLEAATASKLHHPNTVTVFDYGVASDGIYFMAMEYLEGRTLHRLIRDESPLDPTRVVHIVLQICRSVREAHTHGVIHRDLKPANIYLIRHDDDPDFVKVLDFGLVKSVVEDGPGGEHLTQTGLFMGSPKYMAPEQIRGERVSAATDVYALGVILYEMLVGKVPFDRPNSVNVLMAHVSEPVPALGVMNPDVIVPPPLEEIVYKCLAKRAEDRFATMDDLIAALKHAVHLPTGPYSTIAPGDVIPYHSSGNVRLHPSGQTSAPNPVALTPPSSPAEPAVDGSGAVSLTSLPTTRAQSPAPSAGPKWRVAAAVVACAAVLSALGIGFAWKRDVREPPPPARGVAYAVPPVAPVVPHVTVALESDPPNADVLENGAVIGQTPLRTEWTGPQGDPARTHAFTFRLAGYDDASVTLSGPTLAQTVHLRQSAAPPTTRPDAVPSVSPPSLSAHRVPPHRVLGPGQQVRGHDAGALPQGYHGAYD